MNKDCVSLEVAKELQAAGYKGKSEWWWTVNTNGKMADGNPASASWLTHEGDREDLVESFVKRYPAPTTTQLAEELPKEQPGIDIKYSSEYFLEIEYVDGWRVSYYGFDTYFTASTLPDALGKMMVYLLKEKLL